MKIFSTFPRIISGKVHLDIKPITLTPIIEEALDAVRPAAEAKSIRLNVSIDPDADQLRADPGRLQQIIWNLVSNSIKFTPARGEVTVNVGRNASMTQISVSDTGEGINPKFLPYVFDRFQQADSSVTRKHGGLGLGLSITRHLVELHGGTIEAHSEGEGRGATFTVELPIRAVYSETSLTRDSGDRHWDLRVRASNEPSNLQGIKILAVDDSTDTRELLSVVLENCGATVITASSAREALDVFAGWKPNLIICDIGMPELDGCAFIKSIRELPREQGGGTPAIALTGYARVEDRDRVLEAGYQMFVPKPIEAAKLCSIIANLVSDNAHS